MIQSWLKGKAPGEERKGINEIRQSRSDEYREYVSSELPYRMLAALSIFFFVVVVGVEAYRRTVVTYRAPFPTGEELANLTLSVHFSLAATSDDVRSVAQSVNDHLRKWSQNIDQPLPLIIQNTVAEVQQRSLSSLSTSSLEESSSLEVSIAFVSEKEWPHFSATSVLLTKGKWAFVQVQSGENVTKIIARVEELISDVLLGLPHLRLIVKRDKRERIEPWQIAAMTPEHQKRLTWDCNGLSAAYTVRVVHVHASCDRPASCGSAPSSQLLQSVHEFAARIQDVTVLDVSSEHIFDLNVASFLEEDVQGRQTISQQNMHELLKELDALVSPTQSNDPYLKIVIIHSDQKIVMLDGQDEDVHGASVSEWGAVIVNDEERAAPRAIAALRMLLGIDSQLPPTFKRVSVPLARWEITRLSIRFLVDSALRSKHSIRALRALLADIDSLVFGDALSDKLTRAVAALRASLATPTSPVLKHMRTALSLSESALKDSSLLSLLYFPTEQRFGIFLPLVALYFCPALALLPRLVYYAIFRK